MKIDYRILWIEDDKSWIRVPMLRIEAKIQEYGFKPIIEPIYDCDLENLKYSDYDLILVDYKLNCGDDKYGNNILSLLRNRKILSDAIFYSNTNTDILYDKVKSGKIPNVTIFDRGVFDDDNIDQIYEIIAYYLKKELDLNSMRGIMMAEVAKFDNELWTIINKLKNKDEIMNYVREKKNNQKAEFDSLSDDDLWKYLNDIETSTIHFTSSNRGTYLKKIIKSIVENDENSCFKDVLDTTKKYCAEIVDERNKLAHRETIQADDEQKFIAIRKKVIKHQENFENINNIIKNLQI